jgi:hypothetical protein
VVVVVNMQHIKIYNKLFYKFKQESLLVKVKLAYTEATG